MTTPQTSRPDRSQISPAARFARAAHRGSLLLITAVAASAAAVSPASANLAVGATAPDFTIPSAVAGKTAQFSLREALSKGPVVVYFYPKSFTSVCTIEANLFAEAMPQFEALGASVIGISTDDIETQRAFSTKECRDKFPVGADADGKVATAYDAVWGFGKMVIASRTSYVVTPDGRIGSAHSASDAESHIETALSFVKSWRSTQAK